MSKRSRKASIKAKTARSGRRGPRGWKPGESGNPARRWKPGESGSPATQWKPGKSANPAGLWKPGQSGNPAQQWQRGQSGNPKGRPKAARTNLMESFTSACLKALSTSGDEIFQKVIAAYPDVFVAAMSALSTTAGKAKTAQFLGENPAAAARVVEARSRLESSAAVPSAASGEQAAKQHDETNRLASYRPYAPQARWHAAGAIHDERCLLAGNQLGKTLAGAMEWAMHLTGRYPDWWQGKVFNAPVRMWASGVTVESTRDNPQRVLIGVPQRKEAWGTGTIPKDALKDWTLSQGAGDALDSVVVRWGGGGDVQAGESVLTFKSYERGREKWQGETLDGVWFDEEPPLDIYSEGRTRTVAQRGIVILTLTPLLGMTELVKLFLSESELEKMRRR
jgi:phage terminase large subunit-like protein